MVPLEGWPKVAKFTSEVVMSRVCLALVVALALGGMGCGGYGMNMSNGGMPMIASLNPNTVNASDPGFMLTVNGSGFGTDSVVFWNGEALHSSYSTGTVVTAQVPSVDVMSAGMFPVTVKSGGRTSNMINFTVQ